MKKCGLCARAGFGRGIAPFSLVTSTGVLLFVVLSCAVAFGQEQGKNAPWVTGKTYVGNAQVPFAAGVAYETLAYLALVLPTAVGAVPARFILSISGGISQRYSLIIL